MYLRFIAGAELESPTKQDGLFTEVEYLRKSSKLESYQIEYVKEIFKYFNDNLPVPPFSSKRWPTNAVSWFKDSAEEYISRMWDLVSILRENDINVKVLKTEKPGMILYEDDFQIVAKSKYY